MSNSICLIWPRLTLNSICLICALFDVKQYLPHLAPHLTSSSICLIWPYLASFEFKQYLPHLTSNSICLKCTCTASMCMRALNVHVWPKCAHLASMYMHCLNLCGINMHVASICMQIEAVHTIEAARTLRQCAN